jgi:hypothetical protein
MACAVGNGSLAERQERVHEDKWELEPGIQEFLERVNVTVATRSRKARKGGASVMHAEANRVKLMVPDRRGP